MELSPKEIKSKVKSAIKDDSLRKAVYNATVSTGVTRERIISEIPYWEKLRSKAHLIKKETIDNLDKYLELFEKKCIENKINVHWAVDSKEARDIILKIAKEKEVTRIVKSKSLTTEEINLNDELVNSGIETLETDLGEYIIQLKKQAPSHLIIPALHLSKEDVGKLFEEKLNIEYTSDPKKLLKVAREKLREKFLIADMSVTGANFGIAESGAFCIIENEANAHLSISLPKIHVALMGIEKMIPDIKALPYFLKLLAPSATGQKSSTYVNLVGGPSREKYNEGPEEVHIILLDNGRSKILEDQDLRETLYCIRCGACLNACPVYQEIGGHAYNWVYMGPIGITLIPQYLGEIEGKHAPYLSSLCGACYEVCPVKINLPEHILKLREKVVEKGASNIFEKTGMKIWSFAAQRTKIYRFLSWFPTKIQKLLPNGKSFPAPGYYKERILPEFDSKGFRKRFYELERSSKNEK